MRNHALTMHVLFGSGSAKREGDKKHDGKTTLYYSNTCGHCTKVAEIWKGWEQDSAHKCHSRIRSVECNEKPAECRGIDGTPTIIHPSGKHYNGNRSEQSLMDFVLQE